MTLEIMRGFSRAFCDALATRDAAPVAPFLDEQIEWAIFGPIDLFPFFGQRRGREAVLAIVREMADSLKLRHCEPEKTLIDSENAAVLFKMSALHVKSGRTLTVRVALFATLRADKLASLRVVFDTFDAVEQALGREIDLSNVA